MNNKRSFSQYFLTVTFILLFIGLAVSFIIIPDKDFSENENRVLTTLPDFSLKKLFFEDYTSELSDYCSDQFPWRDVFVNIKSSGEILMLKGESSGIIPSKNGYLISDLGIADEKTIKENLSHIDAFAQKCPVPVYSALVPTRSYVLRDKLPFLYPVAEVERHYQILDANMPESVTKIDLSTTLCDHSSEYIYYKTDHHWTSLGAYYAYVRIVTDLGQTPYSLSEFTRETVSDEFFGTTWSFAGIPFVSPDEMELFRFENDGDYTVLINNKTTQSGLYDFAAIAAKDKYSAFVTNTVNGLIKISSEDNSETLVIIKDSFAHSIAPFLARHYNIVMIDPRYHTILRGSVDKIIEQENATAVLFLMGTQGIFDGSGKLSTLRNN